MVLQDLNILTDVSREMLAAHAHEDPLEHGKQWGMIQNQNVKVYSNHSTGLATYMEPNVEIQYSGEQEHDRRRQRHRLKHLPTQQFPQNVLYRVILLNMNLPKPRPPSRNNRRRREAASRHQNLQQSQPH